ncbi:TPA: hypothetical protein ON570_004115 [Citrobacter werkmanii]|nr:hypothetical protein [Citrobacter werkmanii]
MTGRLVAMEVLTAFTTPEGKAVSWAGVTDILTPEYKWLNFVRQLLCVRQWQDWFDRHQLCVSLNLDGDTAIWLLRDRHVQTLLTTMPFIRLEVNEMFPCAIKDGLLGHLLPHADLWLDDVGSGNRNNFGLLVRGYFGAAKIDKVFFWQHHDTTDMAGLGKVIRDLTRYAGHVIVEGIEHPGHLSPLTGYPDCWLQGYLFPRADIEHITDIPLDITCAAG